MSACAACRQPGRCCTGLLLIPSPEHPTALHALVWLATRHHSAPDGSNSQLGLPFVPLVQLPSATWRYWCPVLTPAGRCGDYENRPDLCRSYEPKSDPLCAEYEPIDYPEKEDSPCSSL